MDIFKIITKLKDSNQPFAMATVVQTVGSVPGKVGFKILVDSTKKTYGTVGGGSLEKVVVSDCFSRLEMETSGMEQYILTDKEEELSDRQSEKVIPMMCNGKVWIYFEVHPPLNTVYIFGGGHVGNSLLHHLNKLPLRLVLIDNRAEFADSTRNPMVHQTLHVEYSEYLKEFKPAKNSFIVVMTHEHSFDYKILSDIYKKDLKIKYIGVIASKSKASRMTLKLKKEIGDNINLSNLYMPIGLDIGGDSDAEIALSIAAEIQTILYNKTGIHLSTVSEIT